MHDLTHRIVDEALRMQENLVANSPEEFFEKNYTDSILKLFDMQEPRFDWIPMLLKLGSDVPKSSVWKAFKFGRVDVACDMADLIIKDDDKSTYVRALIDMAYQNADVSAKIMRAVDEILIDNSYIASTILKIIDNDFPNVEIVKKILDMVYNFVTEDEDKSGMEYEDLGSDVSYMFTVAIEKENFEVAMVLLKDMVAKYNDVIAVDEAIRDGVCGIIESGNIDLVKAVLTEINALVDDDDREMYAEMAEDYDDTVSGHAMEDTVRAALEMEKRKIKKTCAQPLKKRKRTYS